MQDGMQEDSRMEGMCDKSQECGYRNVAVMNMWTVLLPVLHRQPILINKELVWNVSVVGGIVRTHTVAVIRVRGLAAIIIETIATMSAVGNAGGGNHRIATEVCADNRTKKKNKLPIISLTKDKHA